MSFFNKYFFTGLGIGILITLLVEALLVFILVIGLKSGMDKKLSSQLSAPDFPSDINKTTADPVNYKLSMSTLEKNNYSLESTRGKVVFLNFWSTWCPPCRAEMPSIQNLYHQLGKEGLEVICISNEDTETVNKFIQKNKYQFPVYTVTGDKEIPEIFQTRSIPVTFILSKDGKVIFKHTGSAKWDDPASIQFLQKLLKE